jgi:hypothetical protein
MSFASSRIPVGASSTDILTSADIGSILSPPSVALPLVLIDGIFNTLIPNIQYPIGVYTGWVTINLEGDATTAFDYLDIIENDGVNTLANQSYFVATTLANTDSISIKYPITHINLDGTNNTLGIFAYSFFTGTAPTITAVNMRVVKVV